MVRSTRNYTITGLTSLLENNDEALSIIERALSTFKCNINHDEESFLHNKAIQYELENKARTYLIVDKNNIIAYFTIAFKSINLKDVSKNKRKQMTGGESDSEIYSAYLIGHIAKNENVKEKIGNIILEYATDFILEAQDIIGGRLIYIDCKDNEKLKNFYTENGFKYFKTSEKTGLLQFYKKI